MVHKRDVLTIIELALQSKRILASCSGQLITSVIGKVILDHGVVLAGIDTLIDAKKVVVVYS